MLELNLNEIWNANEIVAPTHYKKVKTELQGKYNASSNKIIQRYRNLFWLELLGNFLLFIAVLSLILKIGGFERFFPSSIIEWVGSSYISIAVATFLLLVYAFYHWVFYFKYFKDFNEAIHNTRSLDVNAALEVSIKSIQKFRQRSIRFGLILLILGSIADTIRKLILGESIFFIIFATVFTGVFAYAGLTGYYDYMHKPYQVELEILKRQLESE